MSFWGQFMLKDGATQVMKSMVWFHDMSLMLIMLILVSVGYFMVKFMMNKFSSKTYTDSSWWGVLWLVIPTVMLMFMSIPSFCILYGMDNSPCSEVSVKSIGHQWYWAYEYSDFSNVDLERYAVPEDNLKKTDYLLVLAASEKCFPFVESLFPFSKCFTGANPFSFSDWFSRKFTVSAQEPEWSVKDSLSHTSFCCGPVHGGDHLFTGCKTMLVDGAELRYCLKMHPGRVLMSSPFNQEGVVEQIKVLSQAYSFSGSNCCKVVFKPWDPNDKGVPFSSYYSKKELIKVRGAVPNTVIMVPSGYIEGEAPCSEPDVAYSAPIWLESGPVVSSV